MTSPVFHRYDQAGLDAQYDNQRACPGFASVLERARQMSLTAFVLPGERDVRWGDDAKESLDIYRPAEAQPGQRLPVVVYVHGGGWLILDKESSAFAAPAVVADGCLFVALGFHTAATLPFSRMVERVRHGVAWLRDHIGAYGGDPERITLVGHSSGTHLVSQCLTLPGMDRALMVSGLCDLEPVRLSYRNQRLRLQPADVRRLSLIHAPEPVCTSACVVVAEHDTDEFHRQASDMAECLRAQGRLLDHFTVADRNHFDVILDLADTQSRLFLTLSALAHHRVLPTSPTSHPAPCLPTHREYTP